MTPNLRTAASHCKRRWPRTFGEFGFVYFVFSFFIFSMGRGVVEGQTVVKQMTELELNTHVIWLPLKQPCTEEAAAAHVLKPVFPDFRGNHSQDRRALKIPETILIPPTVHNVLSHWKCIAGKAGDMVTGTSRLCHHTSLDTFFCPTFHCTW